MIRLSKDLYENFQRIHPRCEKATRVSSINQQGIHPKFEKATRVSVNKGYTPGLKKQPGCQSTKDTPQV